MKIILEKIILATHKKISTKAGWSITLPKKTRSLLCGEGEGNPLLVLPIESEDFFWDHQVNKWELYT